MVRARSKSLFIIDACYGTDSTVQTVPGRRERESLAFSPLRAGKGQQNHRRFTREFYLVPLQQLSPFPVVTQDKTIEATPSITSITFTNITLRSRLQPPVHLPLKNQRLILTK